MKSEEAYLAKKVELVTDQQHDLALKYMEMARAEILDKVGFVNKTLGGYLLGTSAIASWFYQIYKPAPEVGAAAVPGHEELIAVGLAVVLSYLALGVSWIINHNERMVTALALYQRYDLLPVLGETPPMWEASKFLQKRDNKRRAVTMICIQQMIILTPPISSLVFVFLKLQKLSSPLFAFALLAAAATSAVLFIAFNTARDRYCARTEMSNPSRKRASE